MQRIIGLAAFGIVAALALMTPGLWAGNPTVWVDETPVQLTSDNATTGDGYYYTGIGNQVPASTSVTTSAYPIKFCRTLSVEVAHSPLAPAEAYWIPVYDQGTNMTYARPLFPTDRITRNNANDGLSEMYSLDVAGKGSTVRFVLNHTGATTVTMNVQVKGGQ